jgi:hypothetical protein
MFSLAHPEEGIMAIIDVYVIGDSKFDLTTFSDSALTWGDVGIKNAKDMVDKLVRRFRNTAPMG